MFLPQEIRPEVKVGAVELALEAAERYLRANGWTNGHPIRTGSSQPCIGQALAQGRTVEYFRLHDLVREAAQIQTGKCWRDVPDYNDAPRTIEEVWGVFKIARDLARARA